MFSSCKPVGPSPTMGPVSTPYFASCCLRSSSVRSVTSSSSSSSARGLSVFLVAFCGKTIKFSSKVHTHAPTHARTHPSRATFVGHHRGGQVLVAGEGVRGGVLLAVLRREVLQVKLHVHFFLVLPAGQRNIVGYQLALQLLFRQNRRVFEEFCHGEREKGGLKKKEEDDIELLFRW